jgi:hypothetical protein
MVGVAGAAMRRDDQGAGADISDGRAEAEPVAAASLGARDLEVPGDLLIEVWQTLRGGRELVRVVSRGGYGGAAEHQGDDHGK